MIKVEKMSYSFPDKDLYNEISFSIEEGQHAVLIGSNGTGKTTLADLLLHTENYLYEGKISKDATLRMGYVSQFVKHDKETAQTVFDYLSQDFVQMQKEQEEICAQMETAEDFDAVYGRYQESLDLFDAVDGYNYETNIHQRLKVAGLTGLTDLPVAAISGGEFKLIQVIRQMLLAPGLLIMDEPDVFLDFENLEGLRRLINSHKGTLLVITHNRYLLNHCFDKVLHLENGDLQEFDGNYAEYNLSLLTMKIEMQEAAVKEAEWIEIQERFVEKLRAEATRITNPAKGRLLKGRASYLERLKKTRTKAPFVDIRRPKILLPDIPEEAQSQAEWLLKLDDYGITFEKPLLSDVSFTIGPKDKVAIVGANGTGKTTMLREIWKNCMAEAKNPAISLDQSAKVGFLSQMYGDMLHEESSIFEEMEAFGFDTEKQVREFLTDYCFDGVSLKKQVGVLSGGEKNLLQLAEISLGDANLLILDEPTSHLDTWSQIALEEAIEKYQGAVLMVSHDFYTVTDCADYILYVENGTIRQMSGRAFRKLIYRDHFDKEYLELEQRKKELELKVESLLAASKYEDARKVCSQLEEVVEKLS